LKGCDLKKQTQFIKGQNDSKSVQAKVYGNLDGWMRRKNKLVLSTVEWSQFKANFGDGYKESSNQLPFLFFLMKKWLIWFII